MIKKFLVSTMVIFCAFVQNGFSAEWKDLVPQHTYEVEQIEEITASVSDLKVYNLRIGINTVQILFLENDEIEYETKKFKEDSKRVFIVTKMPLPNKAVYTGAVCVDTVVSHFEDSIMINDFAFGLPGIDKDGNRFLNYTGVRIEGIAQFALGEYSILAGVFEASKKCMFSDAPLYFIDGATKKLFCFNPELEEIIDLELKFKNPFFFTNKEDMKKAVKTIFVCELDAKKKVPKKDKIWICEGKKVTKAEVSVN